MIQVVRALAVVSLPLALVASSACEQVKSSSPLSPAVAGPMEGVTIAAPKTLQPNNGGLIQDRDQPVSLTIGNPETNSPRSVTLQVQIAIDSAFRTIVYSVQGITPGPNGQTVLRLPDRLQSGRNYFWHIRADDGANISNWSGTWEFQVLQPIVIGTPEPRSPTANSRVSSMGPDLVVSNGISSGPYVQLIYNFQVADNAAFAPVFANADVQEGFGETHYTAPNLPSYDKTYFWRVRVYDTSSLTVGNWSRIESLRSPLEPPPPPPTPTPGPSPGPVGNWQACASLVNDKPALVSCVHAAVPPGNTVEGAFEVTKRVAWLLRGEGVGLLIKNGGENVVSWMGYSFSAGRVCYPDGHIYKVLTDVGGANGPQWSDNDFVDRSLYLPAIDPGR